MRRHANRLFPRPLRGLQDRPNAAGFASRLGVRAFVLFFCVVSLMPSRAEAETDDSSWILYGNPEFLSVYAHTGKGNFSSTELTGPRVAANQLVQNGDLGTEVEAPNRSREIIASALVGGTFGFLTPAVIVPSRPRLFLDVNVAMPATTEVQLARSGDPGKLSFPDGGGTSGVLVTEAPSSVAERRSPSSTRAPRSTRVSASPSSFLWTTSARSDSSPRRSTAER
jgi:hypothetical protein